MKYTFIICSIILSSLSCKEAIFKGQYISNFESFVEDVRKNSKEYTEADWKASEEKFKFYAETEFEKFKNDLSSEEKSKVNTLKGNYYAIYAKGKANKLGDELKDLLQQAEGVLNEIEK
jgi:hypothetical protein